MKSEKEIKWWHFWNPESGTIGGAIFGTILLIAAWVIWG